MDAPALVLVPSSPLLEQSNNNSSPVLSSKNSSPVSSDSSYTTPPTSYGISTEDDSTRDSSESTIFSIYSMYSERRHTWRKSNLANNVLTGVGLGLGKEYCNRDGTRDGSRESGSGKDAYGTEEGHGRPSESIADSFYRAPHTGSVSRQSSSGSGFFAASGSASASAEGEGSSRHQSYTYTYNISPPQSRPQSRPASRRNVGSFLDANISQDSGATELPYASTNANQDSRTNYGYGAPPRLSNFVSNKEADTQPSTSTVDSSQLTSAAAHHGDASESWGNYVDLTHTDAADGQPELNMHPQRHSPYSGSATTIDSDGMWENVKEKEKEKEKEKGEDKPTRPPRGSPPSPPPPPPPPVHAQAHAKSESTSTATHHGLALSPSSSGHGFESMSMSMSTSHEGSSGFVTAPQSVESSPSPGPGPSFSTPVTRFRVMNPDPARSPSPSPAPSPSLSSSSPFPNHHHHASLPSPSASAQKALPASPRPSTGSPPAPVPAPAPDHAKRQSSVSSTPSPGRPVVSPSSSSRRSRAPEAGEEPESFFVRNTYAQLDVTGVKGDGYEEGVERTRAKLGHDRRSVQLALRADARGDITGEIPEEELELLKSVDRYGFFTTPSHDRIVMLPASALSKPLHPLTQTSTSGPPSPPVLTCEPKPPPVSKDLEKRRISKWGRMLEAEQRDCGGNVAIWRVKPGTKERKLRSRVFKGIPDAWRAAAWEVLVARWVGKRKKQSLDARNLESMLNDLRREYRSSLDRPSSYDVQIDLDVPRTISGHVMFKTRYGQGQRSLFHTLHSFSLLCNECGYCQGMGPLAATLLCYYEPEKVYSFLVHFHDEYEMHDIFLPGFPGLLEAIYVQERIMERMLPSVYASFKKHMISTTSYATKWYITLFANTVPFQTQLRIWDAFLLEGRDVFVIVAVAIVWVLRDHLTSAQASFETVLSLLSSFFVPEDEDALLRWIDRALDDKKLRADMGRWRMEWRGLVKEKKEGGVLL